MAEVIRAKNHSHTFDIFDAAGLRSASITLYHCSAMLAQQEAAEVARLLTGGNWTISKPKETKTKASQFIEDHVEVRSS